MTTAIQLVTDSHDTDLARCPTCPHQVGGHDPIAARYCAATLAMSSARGCICRANAVEVAAVEVAAVEVASVAAPADESTASRHAAAPTDEPIVAPPTGSPAAPAD